MSLGFPPDALIDEHPETTLKSFLVRLRKGMSRLFSSILLAAMSIRANAADKNKGKETPAKSESDKRVEKDYSVRNGNINTQRALKELELQEQPAPKPPTPTPSPSSKKRNRYREVAGQSRSLYLWPSRHVPLGVMAK